MSKKKKNQTHDDYKIMGPKRDYPLKEIRKDLKAVEAFNRAYKIK